MNVFDTPFNRSVYANVQNRMSSIEIVLGTANIYPPGPYESQLMNLRLSVAKRWLKMREREREEEDMGP